MSLAEFLDEALEGSRPSMTPDFGVILGRRRRRRNRRRLLAGGTTTAVALAVVAVVLQLQGHRPVVLVTDDPTPAVTMPASAAPVEPTPTVTTPAVAAPVPLPVTYAEQFTFTTPAPGEHPGVTEAQALAVEAVAGFTGSYKQRPYVQLADYHQYERPVRFVWMITYENVPVASSGPVGGLFYEDVIAMVDARTGKVGDVLSSQPDSPS